MTFIKTKCPNCGAINEVITNSEHFELGCYECKEHFNIVNNILKESEIPFSESESNEAIEMITSLVEQVQVKMITDVEYYNTVVEKLDKKGLLPKYDKLQQAKNEAMKIINIK